MSSNWNSFKLQVYQVRKGDSFAQLNLQPIAIKARSFKEAQRKFLVQLQLGKNLDVILFHAPNVHNSLVCNYAHCVSFLNGILTIAEELSGEQILSLYVRPY